MGRLNLGSGKLRTAFAICFGLLLCVVIEWQVEATKHKKTPKPPKSVSLKGVVTDSHSRPIAGAKVYLIDSSTLDPTQITPANVVNGSAEAYDEPLEDIVNNPDKAKSLPQATSDSSGKFAFKKVPGAANYYAFVVPGTSDTDHLPGGDASRVAFAPKSVQKGGLQIKLSWNTPSTATYIGTSACYTCHGPGSKVDMTGNKHHGHALMFHKPNQDSPNQDAASHPGSSWNELASKFTVATQAKGAAPVPVAPATSVETLYFQEYNATQSNKFIIYENTAGTNIDPTTGKKGDVWLKVYLWTDGAGNYFVTLENPMTKTDPNNFITLKVPLIMGGYLRQSILVNVPGLKALYRFVQYQAITGSASQGTMVNFDRAKKRFNEGGIGGGFSTFYSPTKKLITLPTNTSSNVNSCAVCHVGAGTYANFTDPTTGELLAHTVSDPNGLYDLGGDGSLQDLGINCEQCHGPGSAHRDANLATITAPPSTTKTKTTSKKTSTSSDTTGKLIVNPGLLANDRASLVCGRCHSQRGILADEEGAFPPPGISRAQFLAQYVNPNNKGPLPANLWPDATFPKGGHHSFTYTDFMLSKHYKNSKQLLACDDCHSAMGNAAADGNTYRYFLKGNPDDSSTTSSLCLQCHGSSNTLGNTPIDVTAHVPQKTGAAMLGESMKCIDCHMQRTGFGGAGRPGLLLGTPTGITTDANITYWQGDQAAHNWFVPRKFNPGVAGVVPASAMPIPYTNACANCHDASKLQFQAPGSSPSASTP